MVGPSLTPEAYATEMTRLRVGFVVLVGASGGLIALSAGADLLVAGGVSLVALALGAFLVWYLGVILPDTE